MGDVADFDASTTAILASSVAQLAGVDASEVDVNVTAGSVHIVISIAVVHDNATALLVASAMRERLNDQQTASAITGLSITSTPKISAMLADNDGHVINIVVQSSDESEGRRPGASPHEGPQQETSITTGLPVRLVVSAAGGLFLLGLLCAGAWLVYRRRDALCTLPTFSPNPPHRTAPADTAVAAEKGRALRRGSSFKDLQKGGSFKDLSITTYGKVDGPSVREDSLGERSATRSFAIGAPPGFVVGASPEMSPEMSTDVAEMSGFL